MFSSLIFGILSIGSIILYGLIWWKIFDKTGYGGAYGLLMFIPIVNFIMLLVLAFTEWPVHRYKNY
ncbi:hypothetical protein SAMN04244560_02495 [Thermoanaerobacter thermohydrosulfuricus]|jgi:uncharacterized membrane protein|uniref:Uncharacterized protein n=4 Tax=Thermoanaerobacter TaxID=1754 RepID=E8UWM7_THEBF|nr:hypothetical protein Thebr_0715 [Thermoanaerobacter brockii subsp. finnii Ako-1]EMT39312.1 hypothetical protein TthWC1_1102 [Thermoanaerobacter thermohydrosulfuricus WC1]SDG52399.1 hypothetical protein SAMN04244560_02495 [Thermoanaerobacter thermohydrosulfuricus]SHE80682.1 hypothetical protein SAMN02745195_01164 [Thermoanaerobacter uzonensis DSM 18761]HBW60090.1 hypothetical protein [Thermoanaerobacter sp.]